MKKIWNNINNQLIIGISSIVFISTFIIALIFLTQYRNLTIDKTKIELINRSNQFVEIGKSLINPTHERPRDIYFNVMRNLTGNDVWIFDINGNLLLSTTKVVNANLNDYKDVNSYEFNYNFSDYFDDKTMTIVRPIIDKTIIGYVFMHQNINMAYSSYDSFTYLVMISLVISLILSTMLGIFYSNHFTDPIEKITEIANEIKNGNYDIKTNIKRDDQIGQLANTIDTMSSEISTNNKEIRDLEQRAKDLVANVSHEFKTPLTLIRGYTMNLKDNTIDASAEVYDKIINNTVSLEKLVNELLELNRYQSGNVILKKEDILVLDVVNDVVSNMKTLSDQKNITFNVKSKKPLIINADYNKIRQLLTIFIDNAIKYSDIDKEINIDIKDNSVIIKDQGIGMEKNELEKIFNRYYKIDESEKGYGLGLFIAKHIVDAHNFSLDIKSIKNKGTTIKIDFNL